MWLYGINPLNQSMNIIPSLTSTLLYCTLYLCHPNINTEAYILKATPTEPQENLNFSQIFPKMPRNGPKMTQSGQIMTQNGSKWAKNDPKSTKMTRTFSTIFCY